VVTALAASGVVERIAVVSPDRAMLTHFASRTGVVPLRSPGRGLNADLEAARQWALGNGAEARSVPLADLPWPTPETIRRLGGRAQALGERCLLLAPDRAGRGTNLLLLCPPDALPFRYGAESLTKHMALARQRGLQAEVLGEDASAFDVDMPA